MHHKNKVDLVILAGGKGTRIKKYLKNLPKPMIKFNNKHFLAYLINNVSKYNFENTYILTGYKSDIIYKKFNNKEFLLSCDDGQEESLKNLTKFLDKNHGEDICFLTPKILYPVCF